jgi:hypothetical protein
MIRQLKQFIARRMFYSAWRTWLLKEERVEYVHSWRCARVVNHYGRKRTIQIMPIESIRNGWRPWK